MSYTFEQVDKALNQIQENHPEMKEIIVFYKEILKRQLQAKENIRLPSIALDEEKTKVKFQKGFPLLELNLIPDSLRAYEPLIERLSRLLGKRGPSVTVEIEKIKKEVLKVSYIFINLAQNYLLHNWAPVHDFAQAHDLDIALLFFFIKSSVKPFMESLAEEITSTCTLPAWSESLCPVCGSMPALAYLKPMLAGKKTPSFNGKKRFLFCSLCNYHWPFPRLKCPFCQTEKQDVLQYLCIDSPERDYRIEVCNDCKGYIKTIDYEYGSIVEELLFLEDLNTIHLDMVAEQEGYHKKAKGVFSL